MARPSQEETGPGASVDLRRTQQKSQISLTPKPCNPPQTLSLTQGDQGPIECWPDEGTSQAEPHPLADVAKYRLGRDSHSEASLALLDTRRRTHGCLAAPQSWSPYTMPGQRGFCRRGGQRHGPGRRSGCPEKLSSSHCPGIRKTPLMFSVLESLPSSWVFSITTKAAPLGRLPWGICSAKQIEMYFVLGHWQNGWV